MKLVFPFIFTSIYAYSTRSRYRYRPTEAPTLYSYPYPYLDRDRYRPVDIVDSVDIVDTDSSSFLDEHNKCRLAAGVDDIKWDKDIAIDAKEYATVLSESCEFKHSKDLIKMNQGENLFWTSSKDDRDYGYISTETWCKQPLSGTNHHTQVVWPTSKLLGCAKVRGDCGTTVVCRYSPPGNYGVWRF